MPHDNHLALLKRQLFHKTPHLIPDLLGHDAVFRISIGKMQGVEYRIFIGIPDHRHAFLAAKMIDYEVVGYAQDPGNEFPLLVVLAASQGINYLDKGLLKNVVCKRSVFDQQVDAGVNFAFVAENELLQGVLVSVEESRHQFLVGFFVFTHGSIPVKVMDERIKKGCVKFFPIGWLVSRLGFEE
jgi:hypothetical protein